MSTRDHPRAELSTALLHLGYRLAGVSTPQEAARIIAAAAQDVLGWDAYSLDLYSADAARIGPGQRVSVGTGLAVAIPKGLVGLVTPRSGLALRHGIALVNAPGVIDSGYRGELRVLLLNTDATSDFKLAQGDRIAQLLLLPIATAEPLEAEALDPRGQHEGVGPWV